MFIGLQLSASLWKVLETPKTARTAEAKDCFREIEADSIYIYIKVKMNKD